MNYKDVYTQEELERAIEESFIPVCKGDKEFEVTGSAQVTAYDSAQVRAYNSAQVTTYDSAQVRAYDSAQVTATGSAQVRATGSAQVTAYDSAQVRAYGRAQVTATDSAQVTATGSAQVTATGSAQVRAYDNAQVTAYDSAQVRAYGSAQVRAYDSAQVTATGSAQVRATQYVAVTISSDFNGKITGGVQIKVPPIKIIEEWCEFYNVPIKRGIAILYKGIDDDFSTDNARHNGITYTPGTTPSAPDWDGGELECGGGLHFSPSPAHTLEFNPYAKHFVACPVKVSEIVVHYPAQYPSKVKAPRVCRPCYEVDINGDPIEVKNA